MNPEESSRRNQKIDGTSPKQGSGAGTVPQTAVHELPIPTSWSYASFGPFGAIGTVYGSSRFGRALPSWGP